MKKLLYASQRGFSLLEALIAALVVALAMLGLARLQGVTLINSGDSRMKTRALNLAQDKIEELRSFANKDTYTGMASGEDAPASYAGDNDNFERIWSITSCPNAVDCKQVEVSVNWKDPRGEPQTVALTSYIASGDTVNSGAVLLAGLPTLPPVIPPPSEPPPSEPPPSEPPPSEPPPSEPPPSEPPPSEPPPSEPPPSDPPPSDPPPTGGNACTGLVTASIITGPFELKQAITELNPKINFDLDINLNIDTNPNAKPPTAICTVLSVDLVSILSGTTKGTYICNIENLDSSIVDLKVGGKEIGLSVNLKLSNVLPSNLLNLLSPLLDILHLPKAKDGSPQIACVNAKVNLPIQLDANANVTLEDLCVVPNLLGQTVDSADNLLKNAGFKHGLGGNDGKVVKTQNPPAGEIESCSGLKIGVVLGGKTIFG